MPRPILGFLLIGLILGPAGADVIKHTEVSYRIAEFGIIFFLFEWPPEMPKMHRTESESDEESSERIDDLQDGAGALGTEGDLHAERRRNQLGLPFRGRPEVFGLGMAQFFITTALVASVAHVRFPLLHLGGCFLMGGGLALSSSAFALQLLRDKRQLGTRFGRASLGVLLFQDLAVVPLLVLAPLLGSNLSSNFVAGPAELHRGRTPGFSSILVDFHCFSFEFDVIFI